MEHNMNGDNNGKESDNLPNFRIPAVDEWGRQINSGNRAIEDPTQRLHKKLRNLLELSKRAATEAEAQQAAEMLQRFLTEHNLDIAQLEAKGAAAPHVHEAAVDLGKAAFKWKLDLAEYIAEFYYCASLVDRKSKTVAFVGRPDNVQALQMLYGWIIDQIKRIANDERKVWGDQNPGEHMDPLRWQVNFGEGAVVRLSVRLADLKDKQASEMARNAEGDVVGLVLHHQREVSDYLESKYGYRTDGQMTRQERESEERWAKYQREQAEESARKAMWMAECLAAGKLDAYYAKYPWERPKTPEQVAKEEREAERAERQAEARERRNERRRKGSRGRDDYNPVRERQENQAWEAKIAGRRAADKVNLQPFLGGNVVNPKQKKVRG